MNRGWVKYIGLAMVAGACALRAWGPEGLILWPCFAIGGGLFGLGISAWGRS